MGECLMYGVDMEARALCAVAADEDSVGFLIGTSSIADNQICRLEVDAEFSRIRSTAFAHPDGELCALSPSPQNTELVSAAVINYEDVMHPKQSIRIYRLDNETRTLADEANCVLGQGERLTVEWEQSQGNMIAVVTDSDLIFMDVENRLKETSRRALDDMSVACAWSPHYGGNVFGLTSARGIHCFDIRTPETINKIPDAHVSRTYGLNFNPNLQHVVATCGADGFVRVWDWRNPKGLLWGQRLHAHYASSVSSESGEDILDAEETTEKLDDGQLERIEEHEDSVLCCAWASADPWAFASLSQDGRVIVSRVSRKHKYALMQL